MFTETLRKRKEKKRGLTQLTETLKQVTAHVHWNPQNKCWPTLTDDDRQQLQSRHEAKHAHFYQIYLWNILPPGSTVPHAGQTGGFNCERGRRSHTPSIAFWHLPPNSARFSYATEGALHTPSTAFRHPPPNTAVALRKASNPGKKRVSSRFKRLWFYLCWCKLYWRL